MGFLWYISVRATPGRVWSVFVACESAGNVICKTKHPMSPMCSLSAQARRGGGRDDKFKSDVSTAAHARTTRTGVRSAVGATRHAHDTRHQATTTPHSDMFALPCPADRERHMCMSLSAGKSARDLPRASALAPETDRPRPPHCCALSAARRPPVMAACSRQPTLHCTAAGAGGCSTVARVTRRARAAAGRRLAARSRLRSPAATRPSSAVAARRLPSPPINHSSLPA